MNDVPETIGPFQIIRKLGKDDLIETFEGFGKSPPHSRVVVRRLKPEERDREVYGGMFRHNLQKLARLCHPNIFTVEYHDPEAFFTRPSFTSQSLDEILKQGPLSLEQSLRITRDLGSALAHAHELGIIHGDLFSSCCFVTEDGRGMLKNFKAYFGPPGWPLIPRKSFFQSPESFQRHAIDVRTDVYWLGSLLWEMLVGRSAYCGANSWETTELKLMKPPPSVKEENPALPVDLDTILKQAMALKPDHRFQTVSNFLEALEAIP